MGTARQTLSDDEFRSNMKEAVTQFGPDDALDESTWQSFAKRLFYIAGDLSDAELYQKLKTRLDEIDRECDTQGNRIFYLATAPDFFGSIARQLGEAGIAKPKKKAWTRIIVEKPFGHDLESARALNKELARVFDEETGLPN